MPKPTLATRHANLPVKLPLLSLRALNRATLARQSLIQRSAMSPLAMIEHLVGIQSQAPLAAYFGLWSRLEGFQPDDLSRLILNRSLVRIVLMRGTVHLVTADDALILRPLTQIIMDRAVATNTTYRAGIADLDRDELATYARDLLETEPRTLLEIRPILEERWPTYDPESMAFAVRNMLPLVQIPPRGIWGQAGQPTCTTLEAWTEHPLHTAPSIDDIVLRYIAAFGPATVKDAQTWLGLTRLAEVFARLRSHLIAFRGDDGRELFDLPDAPRPDPETRVPARILAPFDNVLLGYADRRRIMPDGHQKRIFTINGLIPSTALIDGFSVGITATTRRKDVATLTISLFHEIQKRDRDELAAEGDRLLMFAEPGADTRLIEFVVS